SGSYTYSWSNGATTQDLTSLSAGTYTVTVTDVVCSITSTSTVTITEPAALSVSVQSVGSSTVCSGSTVTLNMSTYASPANTYQWNDANGPISGANTSSYDASVSGTYSLTVTTPDGCTATSSGFAVSIVSMTPPTGLSTSNIQLTKATMNWSSVANAHHYDIRMRAQGSSTWTIAINNISALATSQQKSNLTSSTTYEWQIRSACSAGSSSVSAWSSTQTFTTLTPCTAPLNATTANITLNSADLTWDAVSGAWGYRVRYKQTSQPWSAWVYDTVTTNTYSLTGLPNNTYYHWQVATMCESNGNNNSSFTGYNTFNTLAPCPNPSSLSVSNITYNSAILNWTGTTAANTYILLYRESGNSSWDTITINNTYSGTSVVYTLTGLDEATTYEWGLITNCVSSGSSSTVSGTNFTTALGCEVPTGLNVTNILLDRATMNWTATSNAHHYDVRLRPQGGSWINLDYIFGTSKTKYSLTSGTIYEWQVRGVCSSDTSEVSAWTTLETFSTLAPCSKPTNTNVTSITSSEATLGWDPVVSATSYDVRFKLLGSPWGSWVYTYGITTNQLTQTGLASGTWYHWQVRAVCGSSSNMSGFTSYNTFTTLSGSRINGEENSLSSNLSVYPNPTNGEVNIKFISEELNNFEISIVDAFGKLILKDKKKEFIGEFTKKVDLSTYPRGIYMIQIKTIDSFLTKRIVLQ
ncbi:MAG: hypothetical protein CL711_03100, partial [Chloroflexi bacterium]|nr:hypothetical protein [Chloroflexota bacterium]